VNLITTWSQRQDPCFVPNLCTCMSKEISPKYTPTWEIYPFINTLKCNRYSYRSFIYYCLYCPIVSLVDPLTFHLDPTFGIKLSSLSYKYRALAGLTLRRCPPGAVTCFPLQISDCMLIHSVVVPFLLPYGIHWPNAGVNCIRSSALHSCFSRGHIPFGMPRFFTLTSHVTHYSTIMTPNVAFSRSLKFDCTSPGFGS